MTVQAYWGPGQSGKRCKSGRSASEKGLWWFSFYLSCTHSSVFGLWTPFECQGFTNQKPQAVRLYLSSAMSTFLVFVQVASAKLPSFGRHSYVT